MDKSNFNKNWQVLVLGGKPHFNERVLEFESARNDGRHKVFFARCISDTWSILKAERIDQIAIEAFMDNNEHETPFHFLPLLKTSLYADIPVLVVAAEPSAVGCTFSKTVEKSTAIFGARFALVRSCDPESISWLLEPSWNPYTKSLVKTT